MRDSNFCVVDWCPYHLDLENIFEDAEILSVLGEATSPDKLTTICAICGVLIFPDINYVDYTVIMFLEINFLFLGDSRN